jgi:hypothetical protein
MWLGLWLGGKGSLAPACSNPLKMELHAAFAPPIFPVNLIFNGAVKMKIVQFQVAEESRVLNSELHQQTFLYVLDSSGQMWRCLLSNGKQGVWKAIDGVPESGGPLIGKINGGQV